MRSSTYLTLDRNVRQVRQSDVEAFASRISGGVLAPGDAGYDDARKVWNGSVDRRPALIARCRQRGRRPRRRSLRRRARHAARRPRRRPPHRRQRRRRGRLAARPVGDERGQHRPGAAHRARRPGCAARRLRSRGAGARPGDAARHQLDHRRRRAHARRRLRLAVASLRHDRRQPASARPSSPPTARATSSRAMPSPICSGRCAAAAATSASSPRSSSCSIRSARRCTPDWSSIRSRRRARCCAPGATSPPTAPDELSVWAVLRKAPPLPFLPASVHGQEVVVLALVHSGDLAAGARDAAPVMQFGDVDRQRRRPDALRRVPVGVRPAADGRRAQLLEVEQLQRPRAMARSTSSSTRPVACPGPSARSSSPSSAGRWRGSSRRRRPTSAATRTTS